MLSWLRNAMEKSSQVAAKAEKTTRRSRQSAAKSVKATPASQIVTNAAAAQAAANANQQANRPNDIQKYIRYGFLLMGASIFINNVFLDPNNPDSLLNRALYPKGRGKFALKIEKWDEKIANYRTAYNASNEGITGAIRKRARHRKLQMIGGQLDKLSPEQNEALITAAKRFTKAMESNSKVLQELREMQSQIIQNAVQKGLSSPPDEVPSSSLAAATTAAVDASAETTATATTTAPPATTAEQEYIQIQIGDQLIKVPRFSHSKGGKQFRELLHSTLDVRMQIELEFMTTIEAILQLRPETKDILKSSPDLVAKIKNSFLNLDTGDYDTIMEKLSQLSLLPTSKPPKVFVLTFKGDVMASQASRLREEITAILNICDVKRGDQVVLQLNSGGGTVTGYGLAAAQLQRLRDAGMPLTVCIDEVAASGGYMMAAVGDKIIASPFAIVGSVGVIATIPNFSERLQREGVVVEDIIAGKYKRTLTPYKKPKEEDRQKMKTDIEQVLVLFKSFLKTNRPLLNVDTIATGETWQGPDALRLGLVDELRTTDAYLSELHTQGHEVLHVAIKAIAPRFSDVLEEDQGGQGNMLVSWAQSVLANILQGALEMTLNRNLSNGYDGSNWMDQVLKPSNQNDRYRMTMDNDTDSDDVDDSLDISSMMSKKAPGSFRERIMMVYDQAKNPPMI